MKPLPYLLPGCLAAFLAGLLAIAIPGQPQDLRPDGSRPEHRVAVDDQYLSPIQLAVSADGQRLYVVCENRNLLLVVATDSHQVIAEVAVGRRPYGIAASPDGSRLFVSNRWDDTVSVIDAESLLVVSTITTGGDPHGLTTDRDGTTLYVANLWHHTVSLISLETGVEQKRLRAGKQPFDVALSPDGSYVYVSNQLTKEVPFRTPPCTEVTVIDSQRQMVADRRQLELANIAQGIAVAPEGDLVLVALEIPKNLIPETQIYQGWMVTYGLAVLDAAPGGRVALLLLDEMNRYYADPFAIVFTPDGRHAYVSSSGVDIVSVIDMARVRQLLQIKDGKIGASETELGLFARHLALSTEYVVKRIPTGHNPKGLAISPGGQRLWVANRLADSITVIDTTSQEAIATIDLGGPRELSQLRQGEYLFNHAAISFQQQLSCNTCHPENNVDGLILDIAVDGGLGGNLVDNRTMRGVANTAPFKWNGRNPSLARQEGPRAAQLFFRSHGFTGADRDAVVAFIESIPLPPNRHVSADGLTPAQERGKILFERDETSDGRYIAIGNRCITCHPRPYRTDRASHDVGTRAYFDTGGMFDTPQLNNMVDTQPYLHDGRCWSLEEIWTLYNPYDLHGAANDMTKQELNDLIEYLKTL